MSRSRFFPYWATIWGMTQSAMELQNARALRIEAVLRNGSERMQLCDVVSRLVWQEGTEQSPDLCLLREELVTAITDYVMLHRKNVDLDVLCRKIEIKEKNGRVIFNLPAEVVAWLQIQ